MSAADAPRPTPRAGCASEACEHCGATTESLRDEHIPARTVRWCVDEYACEARYTARRKRVMVLPNAVCASGHDHCWHQWGSASGGISSEGSWARGTNRCCRCGEIEKYDTTVKAAPPQAHGPYYAEILRYPQ